MKLPQTIEGIQREGRTDCLVSAGVEPAWLWDKVKSIGKKYLPTAACMACNVIPNAALKAACQAAACR